MEIENNNVGQSNNDNTTTVPILTAEYTAPTTPNVSTRTVATLLLSLMNQAPAQPKSTPRTLYSFSYINRTPATILRVPQRIATPTPSGITNKVSSIHTRPYPPSVDSDTDSFSSWSVTTDKSVNKHQYNYNYIQGKFNQAMNEDQDD